jgi:hypothetical protein
MRAGSNIERYSIFFFNTGVTIVRKGIQGVGDECEDWFCPVVSIFHPAPRESGIRNAIADSLLRYGESFRFERPTQSGAGGQRYIRQMGESSGTMTGFDVAVTTFPGFDAVQEIADVLIGQIGIHAFLFHWLEWRIVFLKLSCIGWNHAKAIALRSGVQISERPAKLQLAELDGAPAAGFV